MNKKTIGEFIAALRKVNGMTQKQLADLLNVSDKTVSRWERDEGAPDLSLIPVIAEIFNVTCDELLKGERNPDASDDAPVGQDKTDAKSEKQRQRLLKNTLFTYKNRSCIAIGISFAGFITALLCNFTFLRGNLAVLLSLIFFVGSIVCQALFVNKAMFSVEDSDLKKEDLYAFKYRVILMAERVIGLTLFLLGFCLPMLLAPAFTGLAFNSFILYGSVAALVLLAICFLVSVFVNRHLFQKWGINAEDLSVLKKFIQRIKKNISLNRNKYKCLLKCGIILFALLFITLVFHTLGNNSLWDTYTLYDKYGLYFYDLNDFRQYMAAESEQAYEEQKKMNIPYEEEPLSEKERVSLEDIDFFSSDHTVIKYIRRNRDVSAVLSGIDQASSRNYLHVIRIYEQRKIWNEIRLINYLYSLLYVVEVVGVIIYYKKKKRAFESV